MRPKHFLIAVWPVACKMDETVEGSLIEKVDLKLILIED
jgi:hypothetical protein